MKPRARRITIAAAALGAGVVGVLVVTRWSVVRDHVEAWRFQLMRKTGTVEPKLKPRYEANVMRELFIQLADASGAPVIFDPTEHDYCDFTEALSVAHAVRLLQRDGFRVLEQRVPRSAYVVIREEVVMRGDVPPWQGILLVPFQEKTLETRLKR